MRTVTRVMVASCICLAAAGASACRKPGRSEQGNENRTGSVQKPARWVPRYRPPGSENIQGTNLGLFSFNSISAVSAEVVCVAADLPADPAGRTAVRKGVLLRTTDSGQTWTETKVEAPGLRMTALNAVHFLDPNVGWIVGPDPAEGEAATSGVVLKTTDGGATWTGTRLDFKEVPTTVFFADANTGWIGGEGVALGGDDSLGGPSDILATTDGGITWRSQRHISVSINDIFFLNTTTGWASGHNGAIYATTDGGVTWNSQHSELEIGAGPLDLRKGMPAQFSVTGIHFADASHGWGAARSDDSPVGIIVGTVNGGAAWSRLFMIGDMGARDVFFISPTEGWTLATHGPYIYHTVDGGHAWVSETLQFEQQVPLFRLAATDAAHVWAVGGGGIFFRTTAN